MTTPDRARMAVNEIERDLRGRSMLGVAWEKIDDEVRDKIRDAWTGIVRWHFEMEAREQRRAARQK